MLSATRANGLSFVGAAAPLRRDRRLVEQVLGCDGRALAGVPEPLRSEKARRIAVNESIHGGYRGDVGCIILYTVYIYYILYCIYIMIYILYYLYIGYAP